MSLHNKSRSYALALTLFTLPLLAGCSISPVYGDKSISQEQTLFVSYAQPTNHNEQIFYQTLSQRLGTANSTEAPVLKVKLSVSATRIGLSKAAGPENYQVVATANYTISVEGRVITSGTRVATSDYRTTDQDFANEESRITAQENAIIAVAEKVRLALLAQPTPQ